MQKVYHQSFHHIIDENYLLSPTGLVAFWVIGTNTLRSTDDPEIEDGTGSTLSTSTIADGGGPFSRSNKFDKVVRKSILCRLRWNFIWAMFWFNRYIAYWSGSDKNELRQYSGNLKFVNVLVKWQSINQIRNEREATRKILWLFSRNSFALF